MIDDTPTDEVVETAVRVSGGRNQGAAELIEGRVRSVINSHNVKDPELYKRFSVKLDELLQQIKQQSMDYADRMRHLIDMLKEVKNGGVSFPAGITTKLSKALWNNIASWCPKTTEREQVDAIVKVEDIMENDAPDGYENPASIRADILKNALRNSLGLDAEQVYNLYNLVVQNKQ